MGEIEWTTFHQKRSTVSPYSLRPSGAEGRFKNQIA
jgi:hypothetical protein